MVSSIATVTGCPAGASSATTSLATAGPRSSVEPLLPDIQAARRRTSQTVAAMSSTDSASSQPPSIHWKGQNRLPGW